MIFEEIELTMQSGLNEDLEALIVTTHESTINKAIILANILYKEAYRRPRAKLICGAISGATDAALVWVLNHNSGGILSEWLALGDTETKILKYVLAITGSISIMALNFYTTSKLVNVIHSMISRLKIFPCYLYKFIVIIIISVLIEIFSVMAPSGLTYVKFGKTLLAVILTILTTIVHMFTGIYFLHSTADNIISSIMPKNLLLKAKEKELTSFFGTMSNDITKMNILQFKNLLSILQNIHESNEPTNNDGFINFITTTHSNQEEIRFSSSKWNLFKIVPSAITSVLGAWLSYYIGKGASAEFLGQDADNPVPVVSGVCLAAMYATMSMTSSYRMYGRLGNMFTYISSMLCGKSKHTAYQNTKLLGYNILCLTLAATSATSSIDLVHGYFSKFYPKNMNTVMYSSAFVNAAMVNGNALYEFSIRDLFSDLYKEIGELYQINIANQKARFASNLLDFSRQLEYLPEQDLLMLSDCLKDVLRSSNIQPSPTVI